MPPNDALDGEAVRGGHATTCSQSSAGRLSLKLQLHHAVRETASGGRPCGAVHPPYVGQLREQLGNGVDWITKGDSTTTTAPTGRGRRGGSTWIEKLRTPTAVVQSSRMVP